MLRIFFLVCGQRERERERIRDGISRRSASTRTRRSLLQIRSLIRCMHDFLKRSFDSIYILRTLGRSNKVFLHHGRGDELGMDGRSLGIFIGTIKYMTDEGERAREGGTHGSDDEYQCLFFFFPIQIPWPASIHQTNDARFFVCPGVTTYHIMLQ